MLVSNGPKSVAGTVSSSLEKKGILISCQSRSVRLSVRPCVRPSVTFLVNVSPPKPLEVAVIYLETIRYVLNYFILQVYTNK